MKIPAISNYYYGLNKKTYTSKNNTETNPSFCGNSLTKAELRKIADLKVFNHHIYEFKKGIRNLILTTEKSKYKQDISKKLEHEKIDYIIHDIDKDKINVYFGEKPCVDVVKTFDQRLNKLSPEQDFMLGIMLGYDKVKQCARYLDFRSRTKK